MYGATNYVRLKGNVGQDPKLNKTKTKGVSVTTLSFATNEKLGKDTQETKTEWHRLVLYRKLAEFVAENVRKGDSLIIEGALRYKEFEKDGQKQYRTEIECRNVFPLKKTGGSRPAETEETRDEHRHDDDLGDDEAF